MKKFKLMFNVFVAHDPMTVQVISEPYYGTLWFKAGPAQFGYNLKTNPPVSLSLFQTYISL